MQSRAEEGGQQASAVVWHWSEVKPANGHCSSIMRLCRPVRGPESGAATPALLPTDFGCLHMQKTAGPDQLEGQYNLTPTESSQIIFTEGKTDIVQCVEQCPQRERKVLKVLFLN